MTTRTAVTQRTSEVLRLAREGLKVTEIAQVLGVTTRTVERDKSKLREQGELVPRWVSESPEHGTRNRYDRGCRCLGCVEGNTLRCAVAARERRDRGCPDELHGMETGYVNWACRCDECKKAGSRFNAKLVESRKKRILAGDPTVIHGSRGAYNAGCRCGECRTAATDYQRNRRNTK